MTKLRELKFILQLTIALAVALSGCDSRDANADNPRIDEVEQILEAAPIHPGKVELETGNQSSGSNASIVRKYKSDVPFEEAKEFYLEQLVKQGWQFVEERELKDKGRFKRERVLHFVLGEFLLSIQFAGERREVLGWDYAIRIAHPPDWKEKV